MFAGKCFTCSCIFLAQTLFCGLSVAVAAQGLVLRFLAQQDLLFLIHQSVAHVGQCTTPYTYCMHLAHLVGNSKQAWHGSEGFALEVKVETCHYHPHALVCQLVAHLHYMLVKELCLVNAYHVVVLCHEQYAGTGVYRRAGYAVALVADYVLVAVSGIQSGFEYLHFLSCKHGTLHASDQFFGLAREHGAAYHLYASSAHHFAIAVGYVFHAGKGTNYIEANVMNLNKYYVKVFLPICRCRN